MENKYKVGIITISDKCSIGERVDESGPQIEELIKTLDGFEVLKMTIVSDEKQGIINELKKYSDEYKLDLVLTTGGTGFSKRDNTPEATKEVMTKDCPGFVEYMRQKSCEITSKGMLSRGASVIRNETLIINLPGSKKAVKENLQFILPALKHGLDMLLGYDGECGSKN